MLLAQIAEPQKIDWVNAVLIPIIITLALGIPLAVYTGVISSRLQAFNALKGSAVSDFVRIQVDLLRCTNSHEFAATLALFLQPEVTGMLTQGQFEAAEKLMVDGGAFRNSFAEFLHDQMTPEEKTKGFDKLGRDRWREVLLSDPTNNFLNAASIPVVLQELQPDYAVIFAVPRFDPNLRQRRRSDRCEHCDRVV